MNPECFYKALLAQSKSWCIKAIELDMPGEIIDRILKAYEILEERTKYEEYRSSIEWSIVKKD